MTGAGLSMVEWAPIMGVIPPLNASEWEASFELYKSFPEYEKSYPDMDVAGYQRIFLIEYAHRMLGRLIGLVFFIPFVIFLLSRHICGSLRFKLLGVFMLGGLQGLLGWYMVKSGLVDNPQVSQYRLTAHLSLAIVTYALLVWFATGLIRSATPRPLKSTDANTEHHWCAWLSLLLVSIAIISGGFMAGTKAGHTINTFPTMNGQWLPDNLLAMTPAWRNLFENVVTIQFWHRLMALLTTLSVLYLCLSTRKIEQPSSAIIWLLLALVLQITLGISTLLLKVPVVLASAHQAGGLVLLTSILIVLHKVLRPSAFTRYCH